MSAVVSITHRRMDLERAVARERVERLLRQRLYRTGGPRPNPIDLEPGILARFLREDLEGSARRLGRRLEACATAPSRSPGRTLESRMRTPASSDTLSW